MRIALGLLALFTGIFLLTVFLVGLIAMLFDPTMTIQHILILSAICLIPGALLTRSGVKRLRSVNNHAPPPFQTGQTDQPAETNQTYNQTEQASGISESAHDASEAGFNPFDPVSVNNFVQEQLKQGNASTVKKKLPNGSIVQTSMSVSSSSTQELDKVFNQVFQSSFDNKAGGAAKESKPQLPVSADCPGCGSKMTLHPKQVTQCEYCGTKVPYRET